MKMRQTTLNFLGFLFIAGGILFNPFITDNYIFTGIELNPFLKMKLLFFDLIIILLGVFLLTLHRPKSKVKIICASLLVGFLMAEIIIKVNPHLFGQVIANEVLSRNKNGLFGIREFSYPFMLNDRKPNFEIQTYYNGYWWTHQTDAQGFRNNHNRDTADIILLGDSFTYGFGVNIDETVGHFLEEVTGMTVTNLARSGDCSYQQMYVLNNYGISLNPKYVLYFFFENDTGDLRKMVSPERIDEFLQKGLSFPKREDLYSSLGNKVASLMVGALQENFHFALYLGLVHQKLFGNKNPLIHQPNHRELKKEWAFTKKAILTMNEQAQSIGATFIIIPIPTDMWGRYHFKVLGSFAKENNIPYLDTRSMVDAEQFFLPNDGHFNKEGARHLAELIADYIK